jgi:hypothetical protein
VQTEELWNSWQLPGNGFAKTRRVAKTGRVRLGNLVSINAIHQAKEHASFFAWWIAGLAKP